MITRTNWKIVRVASSKDKHDAYLRILDAFLNSILRTHKFNIHANVCSEGFESRAGECSETAV